MELTFPLHRFEEFGEMTVAEVAAIHAIGDAPRSLKRRSTIRAEGISPTSFFLLVDGWVAASHTVPNGGRQILKIHLPGDALGTPSMCMVRTVEELTAITDVTIINVPLERFGVLFDEQPRVIARFMLSIQVERVALMDRLVSIGRTEAKSRVAAFILDLMARLEPLGLVRNDSFVVLLTQEQIGDVLGLTGVHTNRCLNALGKEGLISRNSQLFTVRDREGLEAIAGCPHRGRLRDQQWLPQPR